MVLTCFNNTCGFTRKPATALSDLLSPRSREAWKLQNTDRPTAQVAEELIVNRCSTLERENFSIYSTWWLIPLSKWVITPVINGISRVNPLITGVITHLLSGMSHQVLYHVSSHISSIFGGRSNAWNSLRSIVVWCSEFDGQTNGAFTNQNVFLTNSNVGWANQKGVYNIN